jgi:hypothetical protein
MNPKFRKLVLTAATVIAVAATTVAVCTENLIRID